MALLAKMKIRPILLSIFIVAIAICAFELGRTYDHHETRIEAAANAQELLQAKKRYAALELASLPAYEAYYFSNPSGRYEAAKKLVGITKNADPRVWQYMDWGIYNAEIYGRACLAAEAIGRKSEAEEFRRLAVLAWIKRKTWNYAYQKMMPITPSPDFEKAEPELFTYITRMDQYVREKKAEKTEAEIAADKARLDKIADEVMARRAQLQKSREKK